jgi:ABC-type uncharacterized transport system auxiliary subunit
MLFLLAALLSGCAAPTVAPQDSFYRLGEPESVAPAAAALDGTLVVARFLADGLLGERSLVYVKENSPQLLRQYSYHFWSESPTRMIQDRTVEYLRRAGVATMVTTPEFRAAADYQLTGKIRRLEQIRGSAPAVVVSLEFGLFRVRDSRLLHLHTYEQMLDVDGNDVASAASAMSAALLNILSRLSEDLSRL